jgi:serine/threonine protein kinase/DNA-binding response OmpR family regulator
MARILIVEDNLELANMVRSFLEFEGHSLTMAADGHTAITHLASLPIDLIVLDWDIPGITGIDVLAEYRHKGGTAPVIMLTGRDEAADKEAGLDGGADDYLTKPFKMTELNARVKAQLRRTQRELDRAMQIGDIMLDRANLTATQGGLTHIVTELEMGILEMASRCAKLNLSEGQLVDAINQEKSSNLSRERLGILVNRLRSRLDKQSKHIFPTMFGEFEKANALRSDRSQQDPYLGTILDGKYSLDRLIGGGGTSLVYESRHIGVGKTLAIKVLVNDADTSEETRARFRREARINGQLNHRNIVGVIDFGIGERGQPYLAMDLLQGFSLAEVMESHGRPTLSALLAFFMQACDGLGHAHSLGIVHRDIKPSNIMITGDDTTGLVVKIVDFGLARPFGSANTDLNLTMAGNVVGSAPYMSPEQCRGHEVDHRTDVYSFGCTLFEVLHGDMPFAARDPVSIMMKHLQEAPPLLVLKDCDVRINGQVDESLSRELNTRLNSIIQKCMAKNPDERYQSMDEIAKDLAACISSIKGTEKDNKSLLGWLTDRFKKK